MMRQMPYAGWCIFARNSRTEWPMHFTFRRTRKEAIAAWKAEFMHPERAEAIFGMRVADGSMRVGRAVMQASVEAAP